LCIESIGYNIALESNVEERIQKILARAGFGSRRSCEQLISEGRVTVDGRIAILGMKADPALHKIAVNQVEIGFEEEKNYILLYKPRGVISAASAQDNRKTVRDLVDIPGTLYPVGRLDVDSEGLILLTNDGELTNTLTHPRYEHEKEYKVLVAVRPDEKQLEIWRRGVVMEDGYRTRPAKVRLTGTHGKGAWLQVVLTEGRKRQIREMGRLTGIPIVRIIRVRVAGLQLGNLRPGQWRRLTKDEIKLLNIGTMKPSSPGKRSKSKQHAKRQPAMPVREKNK
jgi:23S rRNA pseudouridine2605 synthase